MKSKHARKKGNLEKRITEIQPKIGIIIMLEMMKRINSFALSNTKEPLSKY